MLNRLFTHTKQDIPDDWKSCLAVLWVQDDVPYAGRERVAGAFPRISGVRETEEPIHTDDQEDAIYTFYRGGWVRCVSCEGGFVGVLLKL